MPPYLMKKKSVSHAGNISYYLGVERISKDTVEVHRRGNQTGLNPPRASFQVVSILLLQEETLPVQGLWGLRLPVPKPAGVGTLQQSGAGGRNSIHTGLASSETGPGTGETHLLRRLGESSREVTVCVVFK